MATRTSSATWEGNLKEGKGTMKVGRGAHEGPFSFASRFENGDNLHALGRRAIAMSDRLTNRQTRLYKEWLVTPSRR